MRTKIISIVAFFVLSFAIVGCDKVSSPLSPDGFSGGAVLTGAVSLSSTSVNLSSVLIGIQGTSLRTVPDSQGNFRFEDLPLGDVVVEVIVLNRMTPLMIQNVNRNEDIQIRIEVQLNNQAVLAELNRNRHTSGELHVDIQPDKWNIDWVNSVSEVIAKISGEGFETIVAGTVKMVGPTGLFSIDPYMNEVGGVYFIAKFLQSEAIGLIDDPKPGESYEISVTGQLANGTSFKLVDTIVIVGGKPGLGEPALDIRPGKWNIAWANSSDEVNAMISGEGFDIIDFATVTIDGPAGSLKPTAYEVGGVYFIAKFPQSEAIKLIANPKSGESHEISVTGSRTDGTSFNLKDTISIVGKPE